MRFLPFCLGSSLGGSFATALIAGSFFAPQAYGQTITFTNIADSTSSEFSGFDLPAINSAGVVAFFASRDAGGSGIYTATSDGGFTTVASTGTDFSPFNRDPDIDSSGTVVFTATRVGFVDNGRGIYKAIDTSGFTTVASARNPVTSSFGSGRINSAGVVAFTASGISGTTIYTATSTADLTPIVHSNTPTIGAGDINSAGVIAFSATSDTGVRGIYTTTNSSSFNTIALSSTPEFATLGLPSINSVGVVAFRADRAGGGEGASGIYTATDTGSFTTIATTAAPSAGMPNFGEFGDKIGINSKGTIAFSGRLKSNETGLYAHLSSDSSLITIVREGDSLFGSTVTGIAFNRGIAEDNDTVAFFYTLQNGVSGIARASISPGTAAPEPESIMLASLGLVGMSVNLCKRRTKRQ